MTWTMDRLDNLIRAAGGQTALARRLAELRGTPGTPAQSRISEWRRHLADAEPHRKISRAYQVALDTIERDLKGEES